MRYFADGWSTDFDGPGRRWIVYLYGCNLRCGWCANPESFLAPAPGYAPVQTKEISVRALVTEAVWRRPLFTGGGGVTFGGGEPTLQAEELLAAIAGLREAGIHTVIESNAATADFCRVCGAADLLICDLKTSTPQEAKKHTGADPELVRRNLLDAAKKQPAFWVRVPYIAGVNADGVAREELVGLLCELRALRNELRVDLLRQHHLGEPKYAALGQPYPMQGWKLPAPQELERFAAELRARQVDVNVFC